MEEGPENKMDPEQPAAAEAAEAAVDAEGAGPAAKAAASLASKSQQSSEKVQVQPVQQSASGHRDPKLRRSTGSQQRPQGREAAATASALAATADKDKQSVATSKTESKLFLVSASTASVTASAAAGPEAVARLSKHSAIGGLTRPSGSLLLRGPRSRSGISCPSSSRGSIASRSSKAGGATLDNLSPGLQSLIGRLAHYKDVGLIAYLCAIPGEPYYATRPPAAISKLQQAHSGRPKSIMKMSKPTVRFEPTYHLEPLRPFRVDRALALVRNALELGMTDATYSPQWATDAARILAAHITQCVKAAETQTPGSRYKIATVVTVMERRHQGVRTEGAVLWDDHLDRLISASVENNTMVAFAVVWAVFRE